MSSNPERTELELLENDIDKFIEDNEQKELLRFVTVGSVDDGKSTLIGRLLHDAKGVYDDQLKDAARTTSSGQTTIDFARLTDGLRAEREQGITIDVAYRYFSTPKRKFIIADTPGHIQYTRNMATGASTANVAVILLDARLGVLTQSRRHAYIASLLGIPHLLVCVNKMDLEDYRQERFQELQSNFQEVLDELNFASTGFVPCSALMGVNIVDHDEEKLPWYQGPTVLEYLETVEIRQDVNRENFRFPVQTVIRPNQNYRGYAGLVVSGRVQKGDELTVLPSKTVSKVQSIDTYEGEIPTAYPPMSVVIRLEDDLDISRGNMLVHSDQQPYVGRHFEAMVVWMADTPLDTKKPYLLKHGTRYIRTSLDAIQWKLDLDTLKELPSQGKLELNDIGCALFTTHRPIVFDAYERNRSTGAFVIIDSLTNNTVGAGMILEPESEAFVALDEHGAESTQFTASERRLVTRQAGLVLWTTEAKSASFVFALERRLCDMGHLPVVLAPQDTRYTHDGLMDSPQGIIGLARRMSDAGLVVIVAASSKDVPAATEALGEENLMVVQAPDSDDPDIRDPMIDQTIEDLRARGALDER